MVCHEPLCAGHASRPELSTTRYAPAKRARRCSCAEITALITAKPAGKFTEAPWKTNALQEFLNGTTVTSAHQKYKTLCPHPGAGKPE